MGTLDGANIEIRERVGAENFLPLRFDNGRSFCDARRSGYNPRDYITNRTRRLREAIDWIANGQFSGGDTNLFRPIRGFPCLYHDEYMLCADFAELSSLAQGRGGRDAYADRERLDDNVDSQRGALGVFLFG